MARKQNSTKYSIYFGLFISILAIFISYLIANFSGAFDKPELQAILVDFELNENNYLLVYGDSYSDSSIVISHIPFSIQNVGEKTATSISITIYSPKVADLLYNKFDTQPKFYGRSSNIKPERKYSEKDKLETISYWIPELNPGEIFNLNEPIILPLTHRKDTLKLSPQSKDSVTDLVFSIPIKISVSAKDIIVKDFNLEIICLSAKSEEELFALVKSKILNSNFSKEQKEFLDNGTFLTSPSTDNIIVNFVIADSAISDFPKNLYRENISDAEFYYKIR